jgi:hypothetical protein
MHLPVALTEREVLQRSWRLAAIEQEIENHEQALAEAKRAAKDALDRLALERRHLATVIRTGQETREVEVEHRDNWREATIECYRLDTGELVEFRQMSPSERQRALDLDDSEKH